MPFKNPHPLYAVWQGMKERCRNENAAQWKDYGGRGIEVCHEWLGENGFSQFLADMGPRPKGHTLDRINNDLGYSRANCRWASRSEQQRNKSTTRKVLIEGIEYVAADIANIAGLKTDTIVNRANKGLTYEEVIQPGRFVFTPGLALGGKASGAKKQERQTCVHGHVYDEKNTYRNEHGHRGCRACRNERNKIKREAKMSSQMKNAPEGALR